MKNRTTIQFLHPRNTSGIDNHIFVVYFLENTAFPKHPDWKDSIVFLWYYFGKTSRKICLS